MEIESYDMAQDVGDLVRMSLSPPVMLGMGSGSALEQIEIAKWRAILQRDVQTAWEKAKSVSPEALRLLELIAAHEGLEIRGRKPEIDATSSARFSVLY